jgi:hypothetical protein
MFTRRPMPHQQQQPQRDRVAQLQQQAGACEFQRRTPAPAAPAAQLGSEARVLRREGPGQR